MVSERAFLLDTGPWVAFLNRRDQYHAWVTAQFAQLRPSLLTCEAVVSETCFLVRTLRGGAEAALAFLERGVVQVPFCLHEEHMAIKTLLARYADVPMSLADACLVRMSEQYPNSLVLRGKAFSPSVSQNNRATHVEMVSISPPRRTRRVASYDSTVRSRASDRTARRQGLHHHYERLAA